MYAGVPDEHPGDRERRADVDCASDAEVGQHRRAIFAKQNVLRLDVAMDEALAMCELEGAADGHADIECERRARTPLDDALAQIAAGEILHGQVVIGMVFAHVEHWDDRSVVHLRDDARLAHEAHGERRIGVQHRRHDLECNLASEALLDCEIDGGGTALTKATQDAISGDSHRRHGSTIPPVRSWQWPALIIVCIRCRRWRRSPDLSVHRWGIRPTVESRFAGSGKRPFSTSVGPMSGALPLPDGPNGAFRKLAGDAGRI